jgi:hypothetical protein
LGSTHAAWAKKLRAFVFRQQSAPFTIAPL